MAYQTPPHLERRDVHPGERCVSRKPVLIVTLLGSCVAACLYDEVSGVAGINHFLLAAPRYAKNMPLSHTDAGRYGIMAMELLINDMVHLGADRRRLKAKVFGGASVIRRSGDNFLCVNEVNQRFIREYLGTEHIPIVSEDLGGDKGRVVYFHTDTFKVLRRFIPRNELDGVEEDEHDFWKARTEVEDEGGIVLFDAPQRKPR